MPKTRVVAVPVKCCLGYHNAVVKVMIAEEEGVVGAVRGEYGCEHQDGSETCMLCVASAVKGLIDRHRGTAEQGT